MTKVDAFIYEAKAKACLSKLSRRWLRRNASGRVEEDDVDCNVVPIPSALRGWNRKQTCYTLLIGTTKGIADEMGRKVVVLELECSEWLRSF